MGFIGGRDEPGSILENAWLTERAERLQQGLERARAPAGSPEEWAEEYRAWWAGSRRDRALRRVGPPRAGLSSAIYSESRARLTEEHD